MVGPEVINQAIRILEAISEANPTIKLNLKSFAFGGQAIDDFGEPLPKATLDACKAADAILMGKLPIPLFCTLLTAS